MTRTDVMASSRPQTAGAASNGRGLSLRVLAIFPVVLLMAMALLAPGAAFAATESNTKSGYNQETKEPEVKPSTGTSPSKETSEPSKEAPASETTPSTTPSTETAKTLPFTGFDLRWSFGIGLLLMGAGFSIVVVQRRQRREGGR